METLLHIDGSSGGGQVLRTALSLSMISGQPFRICAIRGQRSRPGLLRQHLTAVRAAAQISGAHTTGAELNSTELEFRPGTVKAGDYRFAIGTAGSTSLVLQTLIPALLNADAPSSIRVSGGTHNPAAPPFEFIQRAWLPLLRRMGAQIEISLLRHGFAPAGGGELLLRIEPSKLTPLHLDSRGEYFATRADALVSAIPKAAASRELDRVAARLKLDRRSMPIVEAEAGCGPGHMLFIECEHARVTQLFSSLGNERARGELTIDAAIDDYLGWFASAAVVGHQLADQLLLPMAFAGGGSLTTDRLSNHIVSNAGVIQRFLPMAITTHEHGDHVALSLNRPAVR